MSTITTAPVYVQFAQALRTAIRAAGLPEPESADTETGFPQNNGFFFVEWGPHLVAPALIVPKSATRMGNLHSHVDLSGAPGYIKLPKKNGRVVCHFEPDLSKVSKVLHLFVNASKRPIAAPTRRLVSASPTTSQPASQAPLYTTSQMASEVASWSTPESYTDEEADAALQALRNA